MRASTESWRGRIALMVAHCAGMIDLVALPGLGRRADLAVRFSPQQAGGLATLFLIGAVLSSLFFAPRFNRINSRFAGDRGLRPRRSRLLRRRSSSTSRPWRSCMLLAGASVGCALSFTHGTIAHSANPHRLFAIVGMALGVFAIVFLGATPNLIAAFGGPPCSGPLPLIMAVAAVAAIVSFPKATERSDEDLIDEVTHLRPAVWFGVAGVSCMALTQAMMFSFVERIGMDRGFGARSGDRRADHTRLRQSLPGAAGGDAGKAVSRKRRAPCRAGLPSPDRARHLVQRKLSRLTPCRRSSSRR